MLTSPDHAPRLAALDAEAAALIAKYPQKRSAMLPLLHLAQERLGWVSKEVMEWVAPKLDVAPMQVYEVVTFYPMFRQKPIGKQHVRVCRTLSCALRGSYHTMEALEKEFGFKRGETSADGAVTLEFVECIAQCGPGPVVQTSDALFENVAGETKVGELVKHLRETVKAGNIGKREVKLGGPSGIFDGNSVMQNTLLFFTAAGLSITLAIRLYSLMLAAQRYLEAKTELTLRQTKKLGTQ